MLEWDIEILANLLLTRHHLDNLIWEVGRIGVVKTNPLNLFDTA
jgi:hypothetical protein